jgi:hypothetical protein
MSYFSKLCEQELEENSANAGVSNKEKRSGSGAFRNKGDVSQKFTHCHRRSAGLLRSSMLAMRQARNSMIKKDMKSSHGEGCVSNVRKLVVGRRSTIEGTIQMVKVAGTDAPATSVHRST